MLPASSVLLFQVHCECNNNILECPVTMHVEAPDHVDEGEVADMYVEFENSDYLPQYVEMDV